MKRNFIYTILPLSLLLLISNGCSDDFVDFKPISKASTETFYTTMEAADMATTVCYSMFSQISTWDLVIMMNLGSIASDEAECAAGGKSDIPHYQRLDQLRHLASDADLFERAYGYLYKTIGYCNVSLERLPLISKETDPDFNAAVIKRQLAEARFIRAFNYMQLVMLFGGVPLVDHVQTPDEYAQPRAEIHEIFSLIKSDLEIAIADLPTKKQWGSNNVGRASKGAAMGLMAKVHLFESSYAKYHAGDDRFKNLNQEWDEVITWVEKIEELNEYHLIGIDGERFNTWRSSNTGGYQWIFMLDADNSDENLFEIQNAMDGKGWWNTRGQGLTRWCAPRRINMNESDEVQDYGWGWWAPSQKLVDTYEVGDPRKNATVMDRGDSILCYFANDGGEAWRTVNFDELFDGTGLHRQSKKYECAYHEYWYAGESWDSGPINVKLMRYADVLLWAAEAHLELGDEANALKYINMVRTRARNSGDTGAPADLTSLTHIDIENERLVELGCEGHRMFDVIRWNKGSEYLNHKLADGDQIEYIPGKHEFYPLPETEINITKGALQQYEGW